ncbi:MAG: hypothetical protein M9913_09430 [Bryobacteraceae bacterium]|nr:hypothetical protein [Solibacteraceae bacterium]MCO5351105.1 hypothetical protein [Bryobacteraceae bacterium]
MSIDLTNLSPEARAELERALSASKGAGASSGSPAPRPAQLEDIRPGMSREDDARVREAILKAIRRP